MMESIANPDEDEDEEDVKETEAELDAKMKEFEELMDRRPFLVNDVLLRRNPNDVQEWEKRVALWGEDDEKVGYLSVTSRIVPDAFLRLQRHTLKRSRLSILAGLLQTSIACTSTLRSSMKRVERRAKQKQTWTMPERFLRKQRKSTSKLWTILLRSGVSGQSWKFVKSESMPIHL